ncbi:EmrB/QacA subfamily drug resistance transporter [Pullulanibacillus pueri]|uniref:Putative MFS-type transporter YhcA n=1 Tax=Pullulanibacillus pueri TaxID=1437324 RepID=A0A8J3A4A4_9BACL|nr:DHA2 family efflux MFS transporter permease subunit [Pullulanibacillus pueri]MBM7680220.1 EmrB/QacA subfamily drug resistance transporter [Pullulanibacillus pueri]GGH89051.1 putative MFS-type transporter YhcA [Pullulanibacillus pueri]
MTNENTVDNAKVQINPIPIVGVIILGAFVAILNQTLMNVALPQIMNKLEITANTAQWLTTVFMLVNGVLIPVTAYLMGRFTTRQLFITAMTLFSIGTLVCGVAPGFNTLVAGRVIQAAGAGILMPLMTNVILSVFPIEKRGKAMGVIGIAMIFAPAIGPTLSGWIVQNYSWRVLFFMILPIGILDVILAIFLLKNVTERTFPKPDVLGIILSTIGFGGILYGFSTAGNKGWTNAEVLVTLGVGIVALLLFVWRQLVHDDPMLEFRVFRYWMFSLSTIINIIITMAMFAAMILVPIYLQNIRGFTPLESGLLLLPGAILMGIMSPITGAIFDKIGPRWLAVVGLAITVITTYMFANLTDDMSYLTLIIMYSARMFGMSMLMMPIMTAGLNALPQRWNAHGTAMVNTIRQVAGSVGTALLITVMTNQTKAHLTEMAKEQQVGPQMKAQFAHLTNEATIYGLNDAFLVATGMALLAFILAFFLRKPKPADDLDPRGTGKIEEKAVKGN